VSLYVLDTDVLSLLMKGRLTTAVRRRLEDLPRDRLATTAITRGELYFGALRSSTPERWLEGARRVAGQLECLPFDAEAAVRYGEVRAYLENRGEPLADPDLRIGAICLATDRTLVSGNQKHFERIPGLRYENWLAKR